MRFGCKFSGLPASVPASLYIVRKTRKKIKAVATDNPNEDQRALIRSVARQLPPEIWIDTRVFPQREQVLLALAQMSETDNFVGGWVGTAFTCVPDGSMLSLYRSAQLLVRGTSGEVFAYAVQFCRQAVSSIVHVHRMGLVAHADLTGVLAKDLANYRSARRFSSGLDRVSKLEQLSHVDQDNTINKFNLSDLNIHKTVYHLGAGTNISSSQRGLALTYDRVVLVDPRCRDGPDSKSLTWEEILSSIPTDVDIVSDVSYGDADGMLCDGHHSLVAQLYKLCESRLVVVKLPLALGYEARGVVHVKPRPHNLEVVVILCIDGDPLDDIYYELENEVLRANAIRNEKMFSMTFSSKIKCVKNTSCELTELIRQSYWHTRLPAPPDKRVTPKKSRNLAIIRVGSSAVKAASRHNSWYDTLTDASFRWDGPTVALPPTVQYCCGGLGPYDPGLPDVQLSLRSVRRAVEAAGLAVEYRYRSWQIVKQTD